VFSKSVFEKSLKKPEKSFLWKRSKDLRSDPESFEKSDADTDRNLYEKLDSNPDPTQLVLDSQHTEIGFQKYTVENLQ
jgi:hypothetical protein